MLKKIPLETACSTNIDSRQLSHTPPLPVQTINLSQRSTECVAPPYELHVRYQIPNPHTQRIRNNLQRSQSGVSLSPFDRSHVGPVKPTFIGKHILAPSPFLSITPDSQANQNQNVLH